MCAYSRHQVMHVSLICKAEKGNARMCVFTSSSVYPVMLFCTGKWYRNKDECTGTPLDAVVFRDEKEIGLGGGVASITLRAQCP
jgi:hypothetical protein